MVGFLDKLFGQSKSVDFPRLLAAVEQNGGKGIVQTRYEALEIYLTSHGQRGESWAGGFATNLQLNARAAKVSIDRGLFQGLQEGQTIVSVSRGAVGENATPKQRLAAMKNAISPFINGNRAGAHTTAFQAIALANTLYCEAQIENGVHGFVLKKELQPPLLQTYLAMVCPSGSLAKEYQNLSPQFDSFAFRETFPALTIGIEDSDERLLINYLLIQSIIEDWNLLEA